jgi:hypothetical protein
MGGRLRSPLWAEPLATGNLEPVEGDRVVSALALGAPFLVADDSTIYRVGELLLRDRRTTMKPLGLILWGSAARPRKANGPRDVLPLL